MIVFVGCNGVVSIEDKLFEFNFSYLKEMGGSGMVINLE